jgi:hypothetical protein
VVAVQPENIDHRRIAWDVDPFGRALYCCTQLSFYELGVSRSCARRQDAMNALSFDHNPDVFATVFVVPD